MKERIYVKSSTAYTDKVHKFWAHILHYLPDISIIEETTNYIHFLVTDEEDMHLRFLASCDFGVLLEGPIGKAREEFPWLFR